MSKVTAILGLSFGARLRIIFIIILISTLMGSDPVGIGLSAAGNTDVIISSDKNNPNA